MRRCACAWMLFAAVGCNGPHADGKGASRDATRANAITAALERIAASPAQDNARWRSLKFFFPGIVEGYRAYAVTEGHDLDLGNGEPLAIVKRAYRKDAVLLDLEVLDTAHTERLRSTFLRMRELTRESGSAVFRPYKLQNRRAFAQWTAQTASARASVLVADRYLVHVSMRPVPSPDACIGLLAKLDLGSLDKLAGTPPMAASDAPPETAIMSEVIDAGGDAATANQPL